MASLLVYLVAWIPRMLKKRQERWLNLHVQSLFLKCISDWVVFAAPKTCITQLSNLKHKSNLKSTASYTWNISAALILAFSDLECQRSQAFHTTLERQCYLKSKTTIQTLKVVSQTDEPSKSQKHPASFEESGCNDFFLVWRTVVRVLNFGGWNHFATLPKEPEVVKNPQNETFEKPVIETFLW